MIIERYYEDYWGSPVLCETIALDDGQPGITYHRGPLPDALRQILLASMPDSLPDFYEEGDDDPCLLEAGDRQALPARTVDSRLLHGVHHLINFFRKFFA